MKSTKKNAPNMSREVPTSTLVCSLNRAAAIIDDEETAGTVISFTIPDANNKAADKRPKAAPNGLSMPLLFIAVRFEHPVGRWGPDDCFTAGRVGSRTLLNPVHFMLIAPRSLGAISPVRC